MGIEKLKPLHGEQVIMGAEFVYLSIPIAAVLRAIDFDSPELDIVKYGAALIPQTLTYLVMRCNEFFGSNYLGEGLRTIRSEEYSLDDQGISE